MRLKSAVSIAAIKAAFTELGLTATPTTDATTGIATTDRIKFDVATLNRLILSLDQGDFLLFKQFPTGTDVDGADITDSAILSFMRELADDTVVSDEALVVLGRALAEAPGVTDEITARDFLKGLLETAVVQEAHAFSFARPLEDSYLASDLISIGSVRDLSDSAALTDELLYEPGKGLSSGVSVADITAEVLSFHFDVELPREFTKGPYFAEDYVELLPGYTFREGFAFVRDVSAFTYSKTLTDTSNVTDTFTRQSAYTREFTDDVYFTDDVDGSASILDDQEMQFFKFTTDIPTVSDSFERTLAYSRAFSDTLSTSESINVLTSKHLYDIPTASETITKSYARLSADSALAGDAVIVAQEKALLNLAAMTDTGSLFSQSYVSDATYFKEDFVGSSTTF